MKSDHRNVQQLRRPRRQMPPLPDSFMVVAQTLGLPAPQITDDLCYTLRRRKEGTEIGLKMGALWWSLSHKTGVYPPGFKAARKWVAAYAARYGWTAREVPRRASRRIDPTCP